VFVLPDFVRARSPGNALRIAMAEGVDFGQRPGSSDEWIVRGHRAFSRDTQHLAEVTRKRLGFVAIVVALAHRDQQGAIGCEQQPAAEVTGSFLHGTRRKDRRDVLERSSVESTADDGRAVCVHRATG
jgi:hypothetical protein